MRTHIGKRAALALANTVSSLLPPTRLFPVRNALYRTAGLEVGNNVCIVGGNKFHYSNIRIADNVWISSSCHFFTSEKSWIVLETGVNIGHACVMGTGTHVIGPPDMRAGPNRSEDIVIGEGSWIGMCCVVTAGTRIGKGCVVAAGSVLRGKYEDNILIAGVPGVMKRKLDES